jgi:hypothetical protein
MMISSSCQSRARGKRRALLDLVKKLTKPNNRNPSRSVVFGFPHLGRLIDAGVTLSALQIVVKTLDYYPRLVIPELD